MTDKRNIGKELVGEVERLRKRIAALETMLSGQGARESEIRLRTAVESLPFDFFLIGPDGRYVMENSVCRGNWGDMVGKRPEDVCPDGRTLAIWQANNRRAFAGEVVEGEVTFDTPAGARYCYNIISPIRDEGSIRGILGVNIDITARKLAEQALQKLNDELEERVRERTAQLEASNRRLEAEAEHRKLVETRLRDSETQYRTLVESADESIVQVDGEARFLFLNRTAAQFLGGKPEDYVGKTSHEIFSPEAAERQARSVRTVMETGRSLAVEVPLSLHGRTTWFSVTFEPVMDSTGRTASVLVVARDVQELHQARKELQAYQDHIARTERLASLGTLSATVAHEMNQPLTVLRLTIQNCLAQLKSDGLSPQLLEDLESCLEEVSAAAAIVGRFRSFARESSKVRTTHVNLGDTTRRVLRLWEEAAREVNVAFSLIGLDELPSIYMDERDAEQLIFSLVENAVQASDGHRQHQLAISGTIKDQAIELAFADDCGGIAPRHMGRLFEPFFTTKDSDHATGLGLCIVERILHRMGGKIRVDNRPGDGAIFVVTLPVEDPGRRTT